MSSLVPIDPQLSRADFLNGDLTSTVVLPPTTLTVGSISSANQTATLVDDEKAVSTSRYQEVMSHLFRYCDLRFEAEKALKKNRIDHNKLKEELDTLEKDIQNTTSEIQNLQSCSCCNFAKIRDLELKKQNMRDHLTAIQNKIDALESEIANLGDRRQHCEAQIKLNEKELVTAINHHIEPGSDTLEIEHLRVRFSEVSPSTEEDLRDKKRCMSVRLNNTIKFLKDKKQFIENNKGFLIKEFGGESGIPINAPMRIKLLNGDPHNEGKVPLEIRIGDELKIVYKPRPAETDQAILKLFEDLNAVAPDKPPLATYKIITSTDDGSFWEFVDGKHPGPVKPYADRYARGELRENLDRLEAVCKRAGITDLHWENVLLNKKDQIVPIDLEVVRAGDPTGLVSENYNETYALSDAEKKVIDQFVHEQEGRFARFVPVSTSIFNALMANPQTKGSVPKEVCDVLKKACCRD